MPYRQRVEFATGRLITERVSELEPFYRVVGGGRVALRRTCPEAFWAAQDMARVIRQAVTVSTRWGPGDEWLAVSVVDCYDAAHGPAYQIARSQSRAARSCGPGATASVCSAGRCRLR